MRELTGEEFGINTFCMSMEGENKLSDEDLMKGLEGIKEIGGLAQVHAESGEIVEKLSQRMLDSGVTGPEGYAMAHSVEAEEEGVMRASTVANQVNCPLLLDSITSNTSADVVKMKKDRGNAVFAAVTPASLACDGNAYWRENWNEAASFLTSPPLRKGVSNSLIEATATSSKLLQFDKFFD